MPRLTIYTHIISEDNKTANHASLAYEDDHGYVTHIGLYPRRSSYVIDAQRQEKSYADGGSDAHTGIDEKRPVTYSRSVELTGEQANRFWHVNDERHEYKREDFDCVTFASAAWQYVTGEKLLATQETHNDSFDREKITFEQTTIGLDAHLRELDRAPARQPIPSQEAEPPAPQQSLVARVLGFMGIRSDRDAPDAAMPREPTAEEVAAHAKARAGADQEAGARLDTWVDFWTSERITDQVNDLQADLGWLMKNAYDSPDDAAVDKYEADKDRRRAEAEADVAAGRAEHKFTNWNAPYVQYYDEAGKPSHRVARDWDMPGDEAHPFKLDFKDTPKPNDPRLKEILPDGYRLDTRSKSQDRSEDRRAGRAEYQPGTYEAPARQDRKRELGD